jgi:predicted SprT family Zn-dependent metalloprotease/GNAT superfamily N-acetyltransferase
MKDPKDMHRMSGKTEEWLCECGKTASLKVRQVTTGRTGSCGRCNILPASHFISTKYGKLRMMEPVDTHPTSHKKMKWMCDCGGESVATVANVTRGSIKTCGRCNVLSASHFSETKYGKLRMKNPSAFHEGTEKIVAWTCDCGRTIETSIGWVTKGDTKSCGDCNLISAEKLATEKFGRLRMQKPENFHAGSNRKVLWICDCGNKTLAVFRNVVKGYTKSCGDCRRGVIEWYLRNKDKIRNMRTPIRQEDLPKASPFTILTVIEHTERPFRSKCAVCGDEFWPIWGNVRNGKALTCGCGMNKSSMAQREILKAIIGLGVEAVMEEDVNGLKYDVAVPSKRLLIEFNGLRWHSSPDSRERDNRKYLNAIKSGHQFLMIFEDEWRNNPEKVVQLIQNRIGRGKPRSVRPSACELKEVDPKAVERLYEENHYIGMCRARVHLAVVLEGKVIAAASFARPTRQSSHPWELVRMASDPGFRVHGIWSKLMHEFVRRHEPPSIVSFSDNRLFGGGVYEKVGFRHDGDIRPDYYWTKGGRRYHKSGLRKKGEERTSGLTETQLREAKGYRKIWDLGKKRWIWRANPRHPSSRP